MHSLFSILYYIFLFYKQFSRIKRTVSVLWSVYKYVQANIKTMENIVQSNTYFWTEHASGKIIEKLVKLLCTKFIQRTSMYSKRDFFQNWLFIFICCYVCLFLQRLRIAKLIFSLEHVIPCILCCRILN